MARVSNSLAARASRRSSGASRRPAACLMEISHALAADTTTSVSGLAIALGSLGVEMLVVGQPPQQDVGIEKDLHSFSPGNAASTSGGRVLKSGPMVTRPDQ